MQLNINPFVTYFYLTIIRRRRSEYCRIIPETKSRGLFDIIIWQGKSERSDWFFLGRDFTIQTVSTETVQSVYFFFVFKTRQIYLPLKLLKENM